MDTLILGLLLLKSRTIYEIRKTLSSSMQLLYSCSTGSIQAALKCLEAIEKSKWDCIAFYISAINYHGLEDEENAKESLKKCIELNDKFVDAYVFLASLIYKSNTELAIKYLDSVGLSS